MATTVGTNVNLLEGQPSIQIISNVPSGYAIHTFIKKSNIIRVSGNKSKVNLDIEGGDTGFKYEVQITCVGGVIETLDLGEVQNQVTWVETDAGLQLAVSDIAQSA